MSIDWVVAKWNAPRYIQAFTTSRNGGHSKGIFSSLNLSYDVGDLPELVDKNRDVFSNYLGRRIPYLKLQHGDRVIEINEAYPRDLEADAAIVRGEEMAVGILTADCLPIFFSDKKGNVAAIAHAGWRGLANSIIENVVEQMAIEPNQMVAFIGPAISAFGYKVHQDVYDAFIEKKESFKKHFAIAEEIPDEPKQAHCNLKGIASEILNDLGVSSANVSEADTYRDTDYFFSYRRDKTTGRMASVISVLPRPKHEEKKFISMRDLDKTIQKTKTKEVDMPIDEF